jgi:predicted TIM-barrel fold metal-dependent hydrolase
MIIDLRTRIWTSLDQLGSDAAARLRHRFAERWDQLDGSTAAHERSMHCVQGSAVFGFQSLLLGAAVPNEVIAEFVGADPLRRIGIAGIDPMAPSALAEVDRSVQLGLSGISISPPAQGFHPAHSAAMRIYEKCDELHLPVFVTNDLPMGASAILEFARPAAFDEVARTFPQLRIVLGELGGPWSAETLTLLGKHEHLFADTAMVAGRPWELYNILLLAQGCDVLDRLLFGSGFPFVTPESAIEAMYSINGFSQGTTLPSIPRSLLRMIVERDSLSVLGIDHEISAPDQPSGKSGMGKAQPKPLGAGRQSE